MRRMAITLTLAGLMTVVTGCSVVWLATGVVAGGAAMGLYTSGAEEVMGWTLAEVKQVSLAMLEKDLTAMKAAKKAGNKKIIELISAAPKPGVEESTDPEE